jgi:hypothetical protein
MKTPCHLFLIAFMVLIAFQACKTPEKTVGSDKQKTMNQTISKKDTIPNKDIKTVMTGKNALDTIKGNTTKNGITKDTIATEKISISNPKIHPPLEEGIIDENREYIDDDNNTTPRYKITEMSNFNPFLEKMYPGVKWKHYDNEYPEESYNVYAAFYKGTEFFYQYLNSFVYYFYDIGQISHADIIKTAIFWILQPMYSKIELSNTVLYDQKDEDRFNHFDYYYTTGTINGEKLEVYTIIRNNQIETFRALKNEVEIKGLGFFI